MLAKITNKISLLSTSIRFQETIFTLPFAFIGSVIASKGLPELSVILWITLALTGGRTLGMASNRIIDIEQDKLNTNNSYNKVLELISNRKKQENLTKKLQEFKNFDTNKLIFDNLYEKK